MADVNVTIRMNEDIKREADELFSDLGISLSGAVIIFLKQSLREQAIPFKVGRAEPNAVTYAAIEAAEKKEDMYGPFDSVADLMEALNA